MLIVTGTNAAGKKVILRAKNTMLMFEIQDGQSEFYPGGGYIYMTLDKEKNNTEKIIFTIKNEWYSFPLGTFESLVKNIYGFEYEKLVPDTNITVSAFEKMKKEADELKKEIERLKTAPVKSIKKSKVIKKTIDKPEVDLLNIN